MNQIQSMQNQNGGGANNAVMKQVLVQIQQLENKMNVMENQMQTGGGVQDEDALRKMIEGIQNQFDPNSMMKQLQEKEAALKKLQV